MADIGVGLNVKLWCLSFIYASVERLVSCGLLNTLFSGIVQMSLEKLLVLRKLFITLLYIFTFNAESCC